MGKNERLTPLFAGIIALATLVGCSAYVSEQGNPPAGDAAKESTTAVVRVIDGDTIAVRPADDLPATNDDGDEHVVRLLGIDAPEMNFYDDEPPECGAQNATDYLAELLPEATTVTVTYDEHADETDRYGRSLAYIEGTETADAGLSMIAAGHATAWTPRSAPAPERFSAYREAMTTAQSDRAGGWEHCLTIGRAGTAMSIGGSYDEHPHVT